MEHGDTGKLIKPKSEGIPRLRLTLNECGEQWGASVTARASGTLHYGH